MVVYVPERNLRHISKFLFKNSYLYRYFLSISYGDVQKGLEKRRSELTSCLKEFRDILTQDDISFTVLVFPWLDHHDSWKPLFYLRRIIVLEILDELGIEHYDLLPCLDFALNEEIPVRETKHDPRHPNDEFSRIIAEYLWEHGFLTESRNPITQIE